MVVSDLTSDAGGALKAVGDSSGGCSGAARLDGASLIDSEDSPRRKHSGGHISRNDSGATRVAGVLSAAGGCCVWHSALTASDSVGAAAWMVALPFVLTEDCGAVDAGGLRLPGGCLQVVSTEAVAAIALCELLRVGLVGGGGMFRVVAYDFEADVVGFEGLDAAGASLAYAQASTNFPNAFRIARSHHHFFSASCYQQVVMNDRKHQAQAWDSIP